MNYFGEDVSPSTEANMRAQAMAQKAAADRTTRPPSGIQMLTKRVEELASYAFATSNRLSGSLDRIFGASPNDEACASNGTIKGHDGEWHRLTAAFQQVEQAISEMDGAARRLETL